jgi:hypothetical protein
MQHNEDGSLKSYGVMRLKLPISFVNCGTDYHVPHQGCKNSEDEVARAAKFYTVAPNICAYSVLELLRAPIPSPRILRWLVDFFKNFAPCATLCYVTTLPL